MYFSYYLIIAFEGDGNKLNSTEYSLQYIKDHKKMYVTGKIGVGQMKRFPAGDGKEYPTIEFKTNCKEKKGRKRRESKMLSPITKYNFDY